MLVSAAGVLAGRTGLEVYGGLIASFRQHFAPFMGSTITECTVGLGPSGELKYPSHPDDARWAHPGVGEFQVGWPYAGCHVRRSMFILMRAGANVCSWIRSVIQLRVFVPHWKALLSDAVIYTSARQQQQQQQQAQVTTGAMFRRWQATSIPSCPHHGHTSP
jgi:hypothetical protein